MKRACLIALFTLAAGCSSGGASNCYAPVTYDCNPATPNTPNACAGGPLTHDGVQQDPTLWFPMGCTASCAAFGEVCEGTGWQYQGSK